MKTLRAVLAAALMLPVLQAFAVPTPNGYVGTFTKSTSDRKGSQVTFANLASPQPFVTWASGHGNEARKVFEDDENVVIIFVASLTGSTESFYLNKRTKRFTVVETTWLFADNPGAVEPKVSHGTLK